MNLTQVKPFLRLFLLTFIINLLCFSLLGQSDKTFEDFKEFFTIYPNKKEALLDTNLYPSKFVLAPVVSYSPETNFGFGLGAKYLFKFKGSGEETRTSNMPMTIQYTLKNQFILYSGFEIFTNQEKWVISGNVRFQNYPRLYYGIGRDSPLSAEAEYDYYQLLFEPIFLKQMFHEYLFLGAGFRYNRFFNVKLEGNEELKINRPEGFNGSTSVGVELAALYDDRDNILNAYEGWYFELTYGIYDKFLGGTSKFELTRFDLRHYITPFQKRKDILAFQFIGHFSHSNVPFSELALFGSSEILRGYREGRYVDRNLLASQAEYRITIKDSRLGFVGFLGTGDVFNEVSDFKFSNLRPNYGAGARFMLDKEERLNIRLDWGFGEKTNNFYLSISEAF